MRVSGLRPGERVTLTLRSTDARGFVWSSDASFVANTRGVVDTRRAAALSGTYAGVWGMGLVGSLATAKPDRNGAYFWRASGPSVFTLSVGVGGRTVAVSSFRREWAARPLFQQNETVAATGFYGSFFAPRGAHDRTAVLAFGGSEGGLSTWLLAARLAADGYPTLALAYFDEPGLPQTLKDIPLEYFRRALTWLAKQPQVNPHRIVVMGESRGSEAALLLGVHYHALVHGLIASVPSSVLICGIHGGIHGGLDGCIGPAWTLNGKPQPYTRQRDNPTPTDVPAAVIPVAKIRAPLFLVCGEVDANWDSCAYARAIAAHATAPHRLYAYPQASHFVGGLLPYEPLTTDPPNALDPADEQAREQLWPHILAFLHSIH